MTEPYYGEIQLFGFNYAPRNWAACNGALIPIQQNTALFALLGTNFGGNGTSNFALPNFVNRAPCNRGQGPGLTQRDIGDAFGENSVTLTQGEMPQHMHPFTLYSQNDTTKRSDQPTPNGNLGIPQSTTNLPFVRDAAPNAGFAATSVMPNGGGQPHENRQPYLAVNFCIALQGVFPNFD